MQVFSVYMGTQGFADSLKVSSVLTFETALHRWISDEKRDLLERVEAAKKFDDELGSAMKAAITEFKQQWVKDNPDAVATVA